MMFIYNMVTGVRRQEAGVGYGKWEMEYGKWL